MAEDAPSLAVQAAYVRDKAAAERDVRARAVLESAATTLAYHAAHPALMKACAYFLRASPDMAAFFENNPDARIAAIGKKGELSRNDE